MDYAGLQQGFQFRVKESVTINCLKLFIRNNEAWLHFDEVQT